MSLRGWYKRFREGFGRWISAEPLCSSLSLKTCIFLWCYRNSVSTSFECNSMQRLARIGLLRTYEQLCWGTWRCGFTQFSLYWTSKAHYSASAYKVHLYILSEQSRSGTSANSCLLFDFIYPKHYYRERVLSNREAKETWASRLRVIQEFLCLLCAPWLCSVQCSLLKMLWVLFLLLLEGYLCIRLAYSLAWVLLPVPINLSFERHDSLLSILASMSSHHFKLFVCFQGWLVSGNVFFFPH